MLVLATIVWGLSFPLIKDWMQEADRQAFPGGAPQAALSLIALRMLSGAILISLLFPRKLGHISGKEFAIGFAIGFINSLANLLQVWGMQDTSPALSAFFTSLGSPLVPVLSFILFRSAVARLTLLGLAFGTAGVLVLSLQPGDEPIALRRGDVLTLLSAFLFAVVIISLSRWGKHARPGHLVIGMLAGGGVPAMLLATVISITVPACAGWAPAMANMLGTPLVLLDVALLVFLPTVMGTYLLTTYQPQVTASRAALIYLLEPLFGAMASLAWGHDKLSLSLIIGGTLILGGNLLAELPAMLRGRSRQPTVSALGEASALTDEPNGS